MSDVPILRLNQELSDKIRAHGAETYPHECCGALLGRDLDATTARSSDGDGLASREVTALFPLVNRRDDSPRNRFSVTSEDVRAAGKAGEGKERGVVGGVDSHPDIPA